MNQTDSKEKWIETYGLLVVDTLIVYFAYLIACRIRFGVWGVSTLVDAHRMVTMCLIVSCIIYSLYFNWTRSFVKRGFFIEFVAVTKYNLVMVAIAAIFLVAFQQAQFFSRLTYLYFAISNELLVYIAHCIIKILLRKYLVSNHSMVRLLVVSNSEEIQETVENLKVALPVNCKIIALAVMDKDMVGQTIEDIPVIAKGESLMEDVRQQAFDEVFLNIPKINKQETRAIIRDFESMGVVCHYNLKITSWNKNESTIEQYGNYTVVTYAINQIDYRRLAIKRVMDILGGFVGLIITCVLYIFIGIAIKIDSKGPVVFSQIRVGKNGRRFKIYKFRSMYIDAEERKKELEAQNEMNGLMFKMTDDPRVTRVGRFLRKTSLDELPQFYNILVGDMSLVGTRPPTEDEFEKYSLYYRRRLCMTPGLTGLWQVSGRSDIEDFDDVVKYDLEYIDNWTIGMDIRILFQTVGAVITRKGSK